MGEIIIVIKSRSQAMRFYEELKTYNVACKVINTPKEAGAGCGLSVKLFARDLKKAQKVLSRGYASYDGIYLVKLGGLEKIG